MSLAITRISHPHSPTFQGSCKQFSSMGDFQAASKLQQTLAQMNPAEVYQHAMWAIHELTTERGGPHAEAQFNMFFEAYFGEAEARLEPRQQEEVQLHYAKRTGINKEYSEGVQKTYAENLQQFLGDASQIDGVDTLKKAHDVAFALFGEKRFVDCPQAKHLAHLIKYAKEDTDSDLIQLVMQQLRTCQEAYFNKNGFLERTVVVQSPEGAHAESKGKKETIFIGGGARSLEEYQKGTSDGRYCGVDPMGAGLVVHFNEKAATYRAHECAWKHYDTPVVYTTEISLDQIDRERSSHQDIHRIFQENFADLDLTPIELAKYEVDLLNKVDLAALYPQAAPQALERLAACIFKKDPLQPQFPQHPPAAEPKWTQDEKVQKVVHALAVIIGGGLLFKYALKPLYLKVKQWWYSNPLPKSTRGY